MKKVHKDWNYKSLSECARDALNAKIREDRRKLREEKRASALMLDIDPEHGQ